MAKSLPILTFHGFGEQASVVSFPWRLFRDGIAELSARGFSAVALGDVVAQIRTGEPLPDRAFVVTIDDGYRDAYERAFPVLQQYGVPATLYVTVGPGVPGRQERLPQWCGRPMLSMPEIREMQRHGITIGAHSRSHPDLTRCDDQHVEAEVLGSKSALEDALGAAVTSFSYPFGRFDHRIRALVAQNFDSACSDALGLVSARSDRFALERIDAFYLRTPRRFRLLGSHWLSTRLCAWNIPRRVRRALTGRFPPRRT